MLAQTEYDVNLLIHSSQNILGKNINNVESVLLCLTIKFVKKLLPYNVRVIIVLTR